MVGDNRLSTATDEVGQSKNAAVPMLLASMGTAVFLVWESAYADGAVGMVMTVLTPSVTLARATSPKGEALLNV